MEIELRNIRPCYMSESEVSGSDIYMQSLVRFEQGKQYMVSAKSGHGKSSLLNFIYGISNAYVGDIAIREDGGGVVLHSSRDFKVRQMSYMFQDLCLFPELTALENVQLKNRLTDFKSESEIESMLMALLPSEKLNQPVATLSLGQRQRVAVVRSLCQPFRFLLLDEPFSHVDNENAHRMASLVAGEVERQHAGLIVTALDPVDQFEFDKVMNL